MKIEIKDIVMYVYYMIEFNQVCLMKDNRGSLHIESQAVSALMDMQRAADYIAYMLSRVDNKVNIVSR